MLIEYLIAFIVSLLMGVVGGLIGSWSSWRYQLVLDQRQQAMAAAFDERISIIQKMVTRQDKSAAVTARFSKAKATDEALAQELTGVPAVANMPHAWDPRTWGKSG